MRICSKIMLNNYTKAATKRNVFDQSNRKLNQR